MRIRSRRHGVVLTNLSTIPAVPTLSAIPAIPAISSIPAFSGVFRSGSCIAGDCDACAGSRADDDACRNGATGRIIKLLAVVARADGIPVIRYEICYVGRSSIQSPE
jgi:hypothetical protein